MTRRNSRREAFTGGQKYSWMRQLKCQKRLVCQNPIEAAFCKKLEQYGRTRRQPLGLRLSAMNTGRRMSRKRRNILSRSWTSSPPLSFLRMKSYLEDIGSNKKIPYHTLRMPESLSLPSVNKRLYKRKTIYEAWAVRSTFPTSFASRIRACFPICSTKDRTCGRPTSVLVWFLISFAVQYSCA